MMKDKALEELFLAQKPHFSDNADFMAALTKRLDAVEYIKQRQEATIRRYKMLMVIAFVVGIVSGAGSIAYLLSTPADVPLFTFQSQTGFLLFIKYMIIGAVNDIKTCPGYCLANLDRSAKGRIASVQSLIIYKN